MNLTEEVKNTSQTLNKLENENIIAKLEAPEMSKSIMRRLAIQKDLKSACCSAPVRVEGKITLYFVCTKCDNYTNAKEEK